MERITAAAAMVECLKAEGVKTVFGIPGMAISPFYDQLYSSGIEHILVRHEVNAGHAASGYARMTGKPAVCVATSGPGATNLITAVATAYMDSIPLVVITGQVMSEQIGRDVFQEADITGAAEPFVKHSYLVKDAESIPEVFKQAFYIAGTGRRGPVLIDIPVDVQETVIPFEYPDSVSIRSYKPSNQGNKLQIKRVVEALCEAKRPLICVGGGIFTGDARERMLSLSEKCDIPVVTTLMGLSSVAGDYERYIGMLGLFGCKTANASIGKCDLLMLLGARIGDRAVTAMKKLNGTKIIHIDIDPAEIGKNMPATIPVVGDLGTVLGQILEQVPEMNHGDWCGVQASEFSGEVSQRRFSDPKEGCVNPGEFIRKLNLLLPEECVVVADVGQNQMWTVANLSMKSGRFMTTGGMGTMGYSIPAAIGAKKAAPSSEVICICGDGGFQMAMPELATAVQHNIPIKLIIMVNNTLGLVREQQLIAKKHVFATSLEGSPDYVKIADAYGIKGEKLTDGNEAEASIRRMLASESSYILTVCVSEDETTKNEEGVRK